MEESKTKILLVIAGPTASGKTDLAMALARKYATEIISADARQFYREMEIATAKPSQEYLSEIPHHFINSLSIHERYSVGNYEQDVIKLLSELFVNHQILILCGGSGFFIQAVLDGFDALPSSEKQTRIYLENIFKEHGITKLQELLLQYDPVYYKQIDLKNPHRLMRAIEVSMISGKPFSDFFTNKNKKRDFHSVKICICPEREILYQNINERVDQMILNGLIEEAKNLYPFQNLAALQTVGYTELFDYFEGKHDLQTAIKKIKQHSRNYAKRQISWFKRDKEFEWFSPNNYERILQYINKQIQRFQ